MTRFNRHHYRYLYIDRDDFDDRFLRFDYVELGQHLKRWLRARRPKRLIAADNYVQAVGRFVVSQQRKADRAALEAKPDKTIAELMTCLCYQAEDDIRRDLNRQMWGSAPGKGHHVPDASEFSGERWVWDEEPGPSRMTGLIGLIDGKATWTVKP